MAIKIGETADQIESTTFVGTNFKDTAGNDINEWVFLAEHDWSSSPSQTVDLDLSGYTAYPILRFVLTDIQHATDAVRHDMSFSTDGGSTFDQTAGDYENVYLSGNASGTPGVAASTSNSFADLVATSSFGNAAGEYLYADIVLYLWNTTAKALFRQDVICHHTTGDVRVEINHYRHDSAAAITDVQFGASSGNVDNGTIRIYGRTY